MDTTSRRPDPVLLTILGIILVLVVLAVVAVSTRDTVERVDQDSPEGVVQRFASAMIDRDRDTARELLAESVELDCGYMGSFPARDTRVSLRGIDTQDDLSSVRVTVSSGNGGDPWGGTFEQHDEFVLERQDGEWRITWAPWQFDVCALGGSR